MRRAGTSKHFLPLASELALRPQSDVQPPTRRFHDRGLPVLGFTEMEGCSALFRNQQRTKKKNLMLPSPPCVFGPDPRNQPTEGQKKWLLLRSQNRTRDLLMAYFTRSCSSLHEEGRSTQDITVKRDKPTTPSGENE